MQEAIALLRSMVGLCAYDEARQTGSKYAPAVDAAVGAVQCVLPEVAMSRTEVKRTLATFRPRGEKEVLLVEMERPGTWAFRFGPRPNDRVNRRLAKFASLLASGN